MRGYGGIMVETRVEPIADPTLERSARVAAAPEAVWDIVSDVTRTPEWSPVVRRCEWLGDVARPEVGAEFVGKNRFNGFRWSRVCVVSEAERPRVFAFSTLDRKGGEQTRWRYRLEPANGGTEVVLSYEVVTYPVWVRLARALPGTKKVSERQAQENLDQSLARIRDLVESTATA